MVLRPLTGRHPKGDVRFLTPPHRTPSGHEPHFRDLTKSELESLVVSWDIPRFRASQILDWIYKKNVRELSEMKNLPQDLIKLFGGRAELNRLSLVSEKESAARDSVKFLTKTPDNHLCETVLIKQGGRSSDKRLAGRCDGAVPGGAARRNTVCVSTQLGCKMGCVFCASSKGKFARNLSAGEILEQISVAAHALGAGDRSYLVPEKARPVPNSTGMARPVPPRTGPSNVTNVVFMGMGEPLDNYDAVLKALTILQANWGYKLGGRRITVSTCGITPQLEKFIKDTHGKIRLSVSLHSSKEDIRSRLLPINKLYNLRGLVGALGRIHGKLKRDITLEYTLIAGVNDSREEIEGVSQIAKRLQAKINLIPYNPIRESDFKTPFQEGLEKFRKGLESRGVRVTLRQTAGRDIDAACGQLRLL